jgi:hypothetical protein
VVIGQASSPVATLDEMTALADDVGQLAALHETAGTNLLLDSKFDTLLQKLYATACRNNPAAADVFLAEALKLLAAMPLSSTRWQEITIRHPKLCTTAIRPIDLSDSTISTGDSPSWLDDLVDRFCKQKHSNDEEGKPLGGEKPDKTNGTGGDRCNVHVHVHCSDKEVNK